MSDTILVLAGSLVGAKPAASTIATTATGTNGAAAVAKTAPSLKTISRFLLAPLLSLGLLQSFVAAGLLGPAGTRARAVVSFVLLTEKYPVIGSVIGSILGVIIEGVPVLQRALLEAALPRPWRGH
jgi:hypothetical protein